MICLKSNIAKVILFFYITYYFLGDDNMFIKIPFESTIDFKTNIYEITKMSLEHDYNVNDNVVLGNFYVSGEYSAHEVSVNREEFKYTLPFTVELHEDIISDTLEFNIEDFSYEIENNKSLKVNIEYSLQAEVKERKEESEVEEELFTRVDEDELKEELAQIEEKEEVNETIQEDVNDTVKEEKEETVEDENRLGLNEEKTIMDTIKSSDDTFITYHIHIVKENETIESICSMYNVPTSLINEYNTIDSLSVGDKILIPDNNE